MHTYKIYSSSLDRTYTIMFETDPILALKQIGAGNCRILKKQPLLLSTAHKNLSQEEAVRIYNYLLGRLSKKSSLYTNMSLLFLPDEETQSQLSYLLTLPIQLAREYKNALYNGIILRMGSSLARHNSLSQTLKELGAPAYQVNTLSVVEKRSLSLINIIKFFCVDMSEVADIKRKVRKATALPAMYLLFSHSIIFGILAFLLPTQIDVYKDDLADIWEGLSPFTQSSISLAQLISENLLASALIWYGPLVALFYAGLQSQGGILWQIGSLIPGFSRLAIGLDWYRLMLLYAELCETIGDKTGARELDVIPENKDVRAQVVEFSKRIKRGEDLKQAICVVKDTYVYSLLADAISTGSLVEGLRSASSYMLQEVQIRNESTERRAGLISYVVVSLFICLIVLMGFLPNFQITMHIASSTIENLR